MRMHIAHIGIAVALYMRNCEVPKTYSLQFFLHAQYVYNKLCRVCVVIQATSRYGTTVNIERTRFSTLFPTMVFFFYSSLLRIAPNKIHLCNPLKSTILLV